MFFVCCGCFTSMSQGNLAGEGTSGARAESSVEVNGRIVWWRSSWQG